MGLEFVKLHVSVLPTQFISFLYKGLGALNSRTFIKKKLCLVFTCWLTCFCYKVLKWNITVVPVRLQALVCFVSQILKHWLSPTEVNMGNTKCLESKLHATFWVLHVVLHQTTPLTKAVNTFQTYWSLSNTPHLIKSDGHSRSQVMSDRQNGGKHRRSLFYEGQIHASQRLLNNSIS